MSSKNVQTIADIARLAGVSKSTVSRALNDSPLIGDETKEKIRAIARQYNFQINVPAQRLSRQESRTIAFVTHAYHMKKGFSVADLFTLEVLGGISKALAAARYDLLLAYVDPHDTQWPQQYLATGRADGFILLTSTRKQTHVRALVEMGAPFIVWGTPLAGHSYCSVTGDNLAGGRLAGEHLGRTGRQRIAFLGGPPGDLEVEQRQAGFAAALQANGLELDPALVSYGYYTHASGLERTKALLEQGPAFDALFAGSDLLALGAIQALRQAGRSVPADVAVIGYDDVSVAELSTPPLTTIRQNLGLIGQLLAQNLIQYLQTGAITNVRVPAELVVRQSA